MGNLLCSARAVSGKVRNRKCQSPRFSAKHSHQTNFRLKKKIVMQKRTEWVQMYSGEASRFSADETNQKGMFVVQREEEPYNIHTPCISQPSGVCLEAGEC